jgi:hypothetical protein
MSARALAVSSTLETAESSAVTGSGSGSARFLSSTWLPRTQQQPAGLTLLPEVAPALLQGPEMGEGGEDGADDADKPALTYQVRCTHVVGLGVLSARALLHDGSHCARMGAAD